MQFSDRVVRLYEQWQRAVRENPNAPLRMGYGANAKGLIHWSKSRLAGAAPGEIPANPATYNVDFGLKPIRRRSPSERLEQITGTIYNEALRSYAATGRVSLPKSVVDDVLNEAWRRGEPLTRRQIENLTEHEIRPMCERYAAAVLQRVHRKYKTNDRVLEVAV